MVVVCGETHALVATQCRGGCACYSSMSVDPGDDGVLGGCGNRCSAVRRCDNFSLRRGGVDYPL